MLREESHRKNTVYGTYYQEPVTVDVDVAEYVKGKNTLVCDILVKKDVQAQRSSKTNEQRKSPDFFE